MSLGQRTSSALLYCEPSVPPLTATVAEIFTKTWEFTAWAACPTSEWPATYTIREIRTGDPDIWTQPPIPPNFIKTVVTCGACEQKTQTITCPVEEAARTGDVTIYGNGVIATPASVPAQATDSPDSGMGPAPGSDSGPGSGPGSMSGMGSGPGSDNDPWANGAGSAPGSGPGSGPGMDSYPESGAEGGGSAPALAPALALGAATGPGESPSPGTDAGSDSPAGAPLPAPNSKNGNAGPGSSRVSGSWTSPAPDSGSDLELDVVPVLGAEAGGSSPTLTDAESSPYATAGAPRLTSALLLASGTFAIVSGTIVFY